MQPKRSKRNSIKKMFSSEKRGVGNKTSLASSSSGTSLTTTKTTAKPLPVAGAIFSPASRGTNELDIEQNIESGEPQNETLHLIDLKTATSEQLCMEQPSEASCTKMFRDFPNSLENTRICRKISEEGRTGWRSIRQNAPGAKTSRAGSCPGVAGNLGAGLQLARQGIGKKRQRCCSAVLLVEEELEQGVLPWRTG